MAGLAPIAFQAIQAFGAISTVAKVFNQGSGIFSNRNEKASDLALAQLQQQQALEQRALAAETERERQEIFAKAQKAEEERRRALKRAVAKQRASFGASGVGSGDGSSEAVLLGLFEESEEEKEAAQRLDQLKLQALNQNLLNTKRSNTLERTQLAERERLKNSSSTFDDVVDLFSIF